MVPILGTTEADAMSSDFSRASKVHPTSDRAVKLSAVIKVFNHLYTVIW